MRHEVAFAGLMFPSLVLCAGLAGVAWFVVDYLMIKASLWTFFWHSPLARLALFFVLFGTVSAIYPDF